MDAQTQRIWNTLNPNHPDQAPASNPLLVLMIGPPLSGKTTLATTLANTTQAPLVHLENDALRQARARAIEQPPTYTATETHATYQLARTLARHALIHGFHVLHDATNLDPNARRDAAELAHTLDLDIVGLHVDTPEPIRNARAHREGPAARRAHHALGHHGGELSDPVLPTITVDGQTPPEDAVRQLLHHELLAPLRPPQPAPR